MRLSLLYVLTVPYVAGLASFGGPTVGGFRLTGWVFVVMLATAPAVLILDRTPSKFPLHWWLPWLAMVFVSLTWTDAIGRWEVQDAFQIATPFVIAPIASMAFTSRRDVDLLLRSFNHCLMILVVATGIFFVAGANVLVRPLSLTAALVGCVFVAQMTERPRTAILGWATCLAITTVTGSRIATVALLLEWVLVPGLRRLWPRVVVGVSIVVLAIGLLYTPVFQQRFFGEEGGSIADIGRGDYQTSGRREVWPELLRDVMRRPWLGAGVGSSGLLTSQVWEESSKPHNDYLRILLEQGVLGLACFLYGVGRQLYSLRSDLDRRPAGGAVLNKAAILGFLVLLIVAYTDNPIVYGVWFMHPLLVLAGASYSRGARSTVRGGQGSPAGGERALLRR